MLYIKKT